MRKPHETSTTATPVHWPLCEGDAGQAGQGENRHATTAEIYAKERQEIVLLTQGHLDIRMKGQLYL